MTDHVQVGLATPSRQSWLFAIGSTFFALGTAPYFSAAAGAGTTNVLCFIGSWFFTSAAWMQLRLSDPGAELDWLSAAVQFAGTVLFNISTGSAVWAQSVPERRHLVWTPDAVGSLAFLVSGVLAVVAVRALTPRSRDWQAGWINMAGSVAFGISAAGAYVRRSGATEDEWVANLGTFLGALCFLAAALLILPRSRRFRDRGAALRQSPA